MSTALMQCRMFSPLASSCFQTGLTVYWGAGLCIRSALHKMCNKSLFTLLNRLSCLKKSSSCFVLFSVCEKGESRLRVGRPDNHCLRSDSHLSAVQVLSLTTSSRPSSGLWRHIAHTAFLAQLDTLAVLCNFTRAIVSCYHGV